MKISKIFHFLYFAVLSIPLISIPIFAIYSQNHEINDNTLQVQENIVVDFNQYRRNNMSNGTFTTTYQYEKSMATYVPLQYGHIYYTSMQNATGNSNLLLLSISLQD